MPPSRPFGRRTVQGIVHMIAPELGRHPSQGRRVACGRFHTSTHGPSSNRLRHGTAKVRECGAPRAFRSTNSRCVASEDGGGYAFSVCTPKDLILHIDLPPGLGVKRWRGYAMNFCGPAIESPLDGRNA